MKTERFKAPGLWVERQRRKGEPTVYVAWKPHTSQGFAEPRDLLRWLKWPAGTPTGDALRQWLEEPNAELNETTNEKEGTAAP